MKARVNLTIDETVLQDTKQYAEKRGMSVSEIVEDYLKIVTKPIKRKTIIDMVKELSPADIDPKADLKELYYQERAKKYGF
ncbi:MAG: DUF6364 family protein [Mucilaginibacter sp.]